MTDQELDRDLRDALRAEAAGVDPEPDDAWDRLSAELRQARKAIAPGWRLAAVAALVVVVALVGAVLVSADDDEGQTITVDRPRRSTSTASTAPPSTSTPSTAPPTTVTVPTVIVPEVPATTIPGTAARPEQFVAVTQNYRLVVVDAETGEEVRELAFEGDPRAAPPDEAHLWPAIVNATVTPDGSTVYYEVCCEPASGLIFRVDTAGGEPEQAYFGIHPTVSPDGRFLAFLTLQGVEVVDLSTGESRVFEDSAHSGSLFDLAWSADGTSLLYIRMVFEESGGPTSSEVVVLDPATDGSALDATVLAAPTGSFWRLPRLPSSGQLTVVEQCCSFDVWSVRGDVVLRTVDPVTGDVLGSVDQPGPVADRDADSSGQWAIVTYADGTVVWAGSGGEGALGRGYVAADW